MTNENNSPKEDIKVIEISNIATLISDKSGLVEIVNTKLCKLFGYAESELTGLDLFTIIHTDDQDIVRTQQEERLKSNTNISNECEIRGIKKNGDIISLRMLSLSRLNNKGEVIGTINHIWDLTKNKFLEESLKERESELIESEIELQGILESTADGILAVDKNGKVIKTNKNFQKLWNIPIELIKAGDDDKLLSYVLDQLVDPEQFLSKVIKLYNSKEKDFDTLHFKDGRIFERYSTPLLIGNEILGRIWSFRDVTDKMKAEIALVESEEKFRSLVKNSPVIIMRIENNGIISFINDKYANQEPEDLIGKSVYDFIPIEFKENARNTINEVFKTKRILSFDNIEMNQYESVKWYHNNVSPEIINGKVEAVNMISMDITEQKQLDIMRSEFVASVSHEIRTPLTIIRESLSILESGITGELNKDQVEIVVPCLSEVDRLSRIINNLLDITKMDGQNIKLEWDMVNIIDLAKSVLFSFQNQASNKNISLEFKSETNELKVYCDRDRIIQVFMNLIGNAVKFTQSGFVRVSITEDDDEIKCSIADSGKGIEEEDLGTVFDRFHQVGKVIRAGESGSGLGLTISKGIVKLHKGKIWVKSKLGIGSEFYFTLPKISTEKFILQNVDKELEIAKVSHTKNSLLLLKIDNYDKLINEFGFESVTRLRDKIFRKVDTEVAAGDFIHRYRESEFVLLSNIPKQNMIIMISNIKAIMNEILSQYSETFNLEIKTGIAVYPDDGETSEKLWESVRYQLNA